MKDWKLLTLSALAPGMRAQYLAWMRRQALTRWDAVAVLYEKYAKLPAAVAAQCVHLDMKRPGWDDPPNKLLNEICAERSNVAALLVLCAKQDIEGDEYVDEVNAAEIYTHLIQLHKLADRAELARQAASFCASTREGMPCQSGQ